ncbi:MAG: hypothetical protein JW987_05260 [Anaerolineaceae bacterium]|nr:hypothetical protein [Anaerolineaceae bacterium]
MNSNRSSSNITGARQTMQTWARVIESVADAPEGFQSALDVLEKRLDEFPYTVFAPCMEGPGSTRKQRVLCHAGETIFIYEETNGKVTETSLRYSDISLLEVGNILLYSWFSIRGKSTLGDEVAVTVEFNESTLRHFEPFFARMRPAGEEGADRAAQQAKLSFLSSENFKFMNFACQNLIPGERVLHAVYQPVRRETLVTFLGRAFYRNAFPAHLLLLTDRELILIGEAEHVTEKNRGKYGGTLHYIPLRMLESVEIEPISGDVKKVVVQMKYGLPIERPLDGSSAEAIRDFPAALAEARRQI